MRDLFILNFFYSLTYYVALCDAVDAIRFFCKDKYIIIFDANRYKLWF